MDDINFDELDKAVASAARPGATVQTDEPAVTVETQSSDVRQPASAAPIAAKRRGQFMDMVHPSSDMNKMSASSTGIRRQAPAVRPLSPSIVETAVTLETSEPTDASTVEAPAEAPIVAAPTPEYTWPDPIDAHDASVSDNETTVNETVTVETVESSFMSPPLVVDEMNETLAATETSGNDSEDESLPQQAEAQESPFVEGAEIEKRPLGAFANPAFEEDVVPESLQTPLVEVEVSDQTESTEAVEPTVEVETVPAIDQPAETMEVEQTEVVETATEQSIDTIETQPIPQPDEGTAQSIPQQYRAEEATTVDAEEHAVFDTESYHQPLPLPEKSRGGHKLLLYTLLAVLMLAIGAAAGYAIFVLKLL